MQARHHWLVGSYRPQRLHLGERSASGARALDAEGSYPEAPVPDYADETASTKVVKIIQSYTGVVNKMVWRKQG